MVTVVGPPAIAVLSDVPSAWRMAMVGMVIVGSEPPGEKDPVVLLTRMQPMAPAFCTFLTLATNVQTPRSTTAILPASAAPFVIRSQPSLVGATLSTTTTACAVSPPSVSAGPNDAVLPASEPGAN